jgi:hypothetical protein
MAKGKKGKKDKGVKTEAQLLKEEEERKKLMEELKAKAKVGPSHAFLNEVVLCTYL